MIIKKTGYFESFDGTKIYYETHGKGTPIIMCYGIGCLINHWHKQIQFFSKNYKVIAFDYRGHNNSQVPSDTEQMSLPALVKDLQGLIDHLKLKKFHLWGHSFGVPLILDYMQTEGEKDVLSLMLANGFVTNPLSNMYNTNITEKTFHLIKALQEKLPDSTYYIWKKVIHNPLSVYASALLGGFNLKTTAFNDIEAYTNAIAHTNLKAFIHLFSDLVDYDGADAATQIKKPTLIFGGEKDTITPPINQRRLHELIENSELSITTYGTHCTPLDLADFVNLKIVEFMKEL